MTRQMPQVCLQLSGLALLAMLLASNCAQARPQEFFFDLEATTAVAAESPAAPPPFTDPSDLSTGLSLLPVSNLIAAAANAQLPAPTQFIRNAMNSGL